MIDKERILNLVLVVPHAGTWIEIGRRAPGCAGCSRSCLTQARGLKFFDAFETGTSPVVPHAGTWIEMND